MTEDLIKQIKGIKQALVNVDMSGDDWEERSLRSWRMSPLI